MGKVNRGKDFEGQVRKAIESVEDVSVDRLLDPQSGYAGVRNICDFIVYKHPIQYYIECKSCYGKSLPFSNITDNQYMGLLEKSKIYGVVAGYMIWFIDEDKTVFVSAPALEYLKLNSGKKSFRISDLTDCLSDEYASHWTYINGTKKRILWNYELGDFFDEVKMSTLPG